MRINWVMLVLDFTDLVSVGLVGRGRLFEGGGGGDVCLLGISLKRDFVEVGLEKP